MLLSRCSRSVRGLVRPRGSTLLSTKEPPKAGDVLRVALVGRPNVGKSTLFNRLTGGQGSGRWSGGGAIVTPLPGTTRDRKDGYCRYGGIEMRITDTGGLEGVEEEEQSLRARINEQVLRAVREADAVLFVIDAREGLVPEDEHLARWLHKAGVRGRTLVVANKAEGGVLSKTMQGAVYDAYGLGLGEPLAISAAHNEGMSDLWQKLIEMAEARGIKPSPEEEARVGVDDTITLAFVGLPNVGKSSLLNRLLGEERVITSEMAGTTRDTVMVDFQWNGRKFRLVDTAGIRKKGKRDHSTRLEDLSVDEAVRALRFAQVVVIVLDGQELRLRRQEQTLIDLAYKEGRVMVLAANKSDLLEGPRADYAEGVRKQVAELAPQLGSIRVIPTSAMTGAGVKAILPAVVHSYDGWNKRVSTGLLNRWLEAMIRVHAPPAAGKRTVRLKYMTQVKARPPTFALMSNVKEIDETYLRFLKKNLQEEFGLYGMDVRLSIKSTSDSNPYAYKARTPATAAASSGSERGRRDRASRGRAGASASRKPSGGSSGKGGDKPHWYGRGGRGGSGGGGGRGGGGAGRGGGGAGRGGGGGGRSGGGRARKAAAGK